MYMCYMRRECRVDIDVFVGIFKSTAGIYEIHPKPRARSCARRGLSAKENTAALRKINLRPLLETESPKKNSYNMDVIKLNRSK